MSEVVNLETEVKISRYDLVGSNLSLEEAVELKLKSEFQEDYILNSDFEYSLFEDAQSRKFICRAYGTGVLKTDEEKELDMWESYVSRLAS